MKIYITKCPPEQFVSRGLQYFKVWFVHRPSFRHAMSIDPDFGVLEEKDYIYPGWREEINNTSLTGHSLFKMGDPIRRHVWNEVVKSYYVDHCQTEHEVYDTIDAAYTQAIKDECDKRNFKSTDWWSALDFNNPEKSDSELAKNFMIKNEIELLACQKVEKITWQEYLLELEIDVTLTW